VHPIILYDGVCGLCNRLVQLVLRKDRIGVFRFASLQSPLAARVLARHGVNAGNLDAVYVVLNHGCEDHSEERVLARSGAAIFILQQLDGVWRFAAFVLGWIPRPLREWIYGQVARRRYRSWGRYDACPLPTEETRARFLDV
jgi:predicted DCC family thiol-disulfide oxidoreductase YuxK